MKRGQGISKEVLSSDLERLKTSIESTVLGITPTNAKLLREKYQHHLGKYVPFKYGSSKYSIDENGSKIIEKEGIILKENEKPITVAEDKNCLYNAASTFYIGEEKLANVLRLLTSIELFNNADYYSSRLRDCITPLQGPANKLALAKAAFRFQSAELLVDFDDMDDALKKETELNCNRKEYGSLVCLMALATVIRSEIISIYTPKKNSQFDELFSRTFKPRSTDDEEGKGIQNRKMTLLWSTTDDISNYDRPNHFILCIDVSRFGTETSVDCNLKRKPKRSSIVPFLKKKPKTDKSKEVLKPISDNEVTPLPLDPPSPLSVSAKTKSQSSLFSFVKSKITSASTSSITSLTPSSSSLTQSSSECEPTRSLSSLLSFVTSKITSPSISPTNSLTLPVSETPSVEIQDSTPETLPTENSQINVTSTPTSTIDASSSLSAFESNRKSGSKSSVLKGVKEMVTGKAKNEGEGKFSKKTCNNPCCSGDLPKRGLPMKRAEECDPNDIGIHFDSLRSMTDDEKYRFLKNVWKPPAGYVFPQHVESGRHWRMNKTYLDQSSRDFYSWLCYSAYYDGVFCLPCVMFASSLGKSSGLKKLLVEPFTRWNGAPSRWSIHDLSELHRDTTLAMRTLIAQMENKEKRITDIYAETTRKRIAENRKKLIPIIKTVALCGQQNIPLRGHRDDSKHIADPTINSGNFQRLLDFRIDSGDEVLKAHFETAPKNGTYRSKTIQNEIIVCCGQYIRESILCEVRKAKFFSFIGDEATDTGNKEQLAVVLRFVDEKGQIREEFIEFIHITSLKGDAVAETIMSAIKRYGLDINNLRGQGYDGASNMAGAQGGASSIIRKLHPKALYFHCSGHRLNLVVADTCKIQTVREMMDSIRKCTQIFEFSVKKQNLLHQHILVDMEESELRSKLLNVCRTRWLLRLDGLERTQQMFNPIINTLEDINENHDGSYDREARADANGVFTVFLSFVFIVNLIIVRRILGYIGPLTAELQKVKLDILGVYDAVDNVMDTLAKVREDVDSKHDEWYGEALSFAEEYGVPETRKRRAGRQIHRANHPASSISDFYKKSLTIPLLDRITTEFNARFSKKHRIHGNGFFVVPSKVLTDKDWRKRVLAFAREYVDDLPIPLRVEEELDLWENFWRSQFQAKSDIPDTITDTLTYLNEGGKKEWYPNIYTILVLIAVVPSSSCSCERTISKLRLLETYLRSTMSQERLNGLGLLFVHYDIKIDYEEVLNIFARNYNHRLQLIDILNDEGHT